jgi:hypothetical protein
VLKNVAGQKLVVFAFDATTNLPKTGDAANLTAYVSKDYGTVTVLGDTSATEMDATNAKGYYLFDLTQAETNADTLVFTAKSATTSIVVIGVPATVFTAPAGFTGLTITTGKVDVNDKTGFSITALPAISANWLTATGIAAGALNGKGDWLTGLPAIPNNWITAAGIAAAALNGKGDWLLAASYTAPLSTAGTADAVWNANVASYGVASSYGALIEVVLDTPVSTRGVSNYNGADTAGTTTLLGRIGAAITITGGKVDVNDKTGFGLAAGEYTSIAAAVLAAVVSGTVTVAKALRAIVAFCAGKSSGGGSASIVFRDLDDTKNVLTATCDTGGNRTAVVRDLS